MNRKRFATLLFLSFFLSVLVVASAAAQPAVTGSVGPNGPEIEPNDDFDTATYIKWDAYSKPVAFRSGTIDRVGDVDFYSFDAYLLDTLSIEWKQWGSPVNGVLSLYDNNRTLLAEATCAETGVCLQHVFIFSGSQERYYLKVSNAAAAGGPDYGYQFTFNYLGKADPNEPNNSFAEATPIAYDEVKTGVIAPCDDLDFFVLDGHARDEIEISANPRWQLLDAHQAVIAENSDDWESRFVSLPEDGAYYLRVYDDDGECEWAETISVHLMDDSEPNDTIQQAAPIAYGAERRGLLLPCTDVDYYRFTGRAKDEVEIGWGNWQLLDAGRNVIANGQVRPYVTLPANGVYYLRIFAYESCEQLNDYYFRLNFLGNNEPNDSTGQARPIAYNEQVGGLVTCGDVDYFTFAGQAGAEIKLDRNIGWNYVMEVFDAGQNLVAESGYDAYYLDVALPASGTYYLKVYTDRYCDWQYSYGFTVDLITQPLYFSLNKSGSVQGIAFTAGDILRYSPDTGRFELYVDMSDLQLNGNLTALDFYKSCSSDGNVPLLGFAGKYTLADIGTVLPQDLVYVDLHSTGVNTLGDVFFAIDGSDVGLTTAGERIDAVASPDRYCEEFLNISTTSRAQVPYDLGLLTVQDEDLASFHLNGRLGIDTAGTWRPGFDGSAYDLSATDVVGADTAWDDERQGDFLWLSFDRAVTLGGIVFAPGDIAECFDSFEYDFVFQCDSVSKFFDASDAGLGGFKIDAFEVGPKE